MGNLRITERDYELLKMMTRLRFLTIKQIAALFYTKHNYPELSMLQAVNSLRVRVSQLISWGFVCSAYVTLSEIGISKAYFLGPKGITYINDIRELESHASPRWLQRKHTLALTQGPHILIANNFLINCILISRYREDFNVVNWLGDRDLAIYFKEGGTTLLFNPDIYLCVTNGNQEHLPLLVEIDRGTHTIPSLRRKIHRYFQFYDSRMWYGAFEERSFPRIAIAAPSEKRVEDISRAIRDAKSNYRGRNKHKISSIDFWLTTFDKVEVFSIDNSHISEKPLDPVWITDQGELVLSPFLP